MHSVDKVALVVVGGIHPPGYTVNLLLRVAADPVLSQIPLVVFPARPLAAVLSSYCLRHWLEHRLPSSADSPSPSRLLIWAFSAGCVGAVGLAHYWQQHRGEVLALFALDGWGVPLSPLLPIYRLSHDHFTHITSGWLGAGPINFYADPPVSHLDLWRLPQQVWGRQTIPGNQGLEMPQRLTAADFLCYWSRQCLLQATTVPGFLAAHN